MPGLTTAQWNAVQPHAELVRITTMTNVWTMRSKIKTALTANNLLDDDNVADVARRLGLDIGDLQPWAVVGAPVDRNNRYELDVRRSFRMSSGAVHEGFVTKVLNCSKRHLKGEYYIAYGENVHGSNVLNTIAYCSDRDFLNGFSYFGQQIANYLNTWEQLRVTDPYGRGRTQPRYDAMARYAPRNGEPEFQSDSGVGSDVHCYCIATPGAAVTLTHQTHVDLKLVLRGLYEPGNKHASRTAWGRISAQADVQEVIPVYERESFERALA